MRSDDDDDSSFTCAHVLQAHWRWPLCTCTQYCVSRASRCVAARRLLVPVFYSRVLEAKLRSESSLLKRACAPFMAFGVAPLSLSLSSALCLCCHSRASFIQRGALASLIKCNACARAAPQLGAELPLRVSERADRVILTARRGSLRLPSNAERRVLLSSPTSRSARCVPPHSTASPFFSLRFRHTHTVLVESCTIHYSIVF